MRKLTRSILAATAIVGLLAIPVVGATADDGSTMINMTLTGTEGTVSITVPQDIAEGGTPVDLGDKVAGSVSVTETLGQLGTVTVSDSSTGLLRTATVSVDSALTDPLVGMCIDDDNTVTGGVIACSADANTSIPASSVGYSFGTVSTTAGSAAGDLTPPIAADAFLNAAELTYATTEAGTYEFSWNPTFSVTLTGNEVAGEYYGLVKHTATAVTTGGLLP